MLNNTYEKHKHLINAKIGEWTILDIVEHRGKDKGYLYAECQCICGTFRDVRLSKLLNGKCLDCGCGHKDRLKEAIKKKYMHLIDTQINGWTILEIIPPEGKRTSAYAKCKCECGTVKEVKISYILSHKSKNCGCGRKEKLKKLFTKNLVGQRFGKLVVLEMLEDRNAYGRIIYRCRCDCGAEIDVLGNSLTTYHTLSCGCLISYWNMHIQQFLERNKIDYKREYIIYIGENYYRFDFYLPKYNLFIEYDGRQHYEPVRFYGDDKDAEAVFEKAQRHDRIKDNYCKENHINLLRIPYRESKNIETIINDHLQRLNEKGFAA